MDITSLHRKVKAADLPLEKLAGNSQISEKDKVTEVARQFEAILLRQILAESQKTVIQSKNNQPSSASAIYQDMVTNQLADKISQSGAFGLAHSLSSQLSHELKAAPAATQSLSVTESSKPL